MSCHADRGAQRAIRAACAASPIFWINAFGWTFKPKEVDDDGTERTARNPHVPFVTYPVQDDLITDLTNAVRNGGDRLIDKSRDMGASWICLSVFHHLWQFFGGMTFLELSRVESLVDKRGEPKSLFWKHDYLSRRQPAFLVPRIRRQKLLIVNETLGSTISGESTNEYAGQASRVNAILLDEFARVQNGTALLTATADATPCRIFNSTPNGAGTAHYKVRFSGKVPVRVLGWWDHPEKGRERRLVRDEHGHERWTSPWYEAECARRGADRRQIAENLDIDHLAAGQAVFDGRMLQMHTGMWVRDPEHVGVMNVDTKGWFDRADRILFERDYKRVRWEDGDKRRAPWRLWTTLDEAKRPNEQTMFCVFADIALGLGASNSVITVVDRMQGRKVAEFADPNTTPDILAREAVKACLFFAGAAGNCLLGWEANGPGGLFGKEVMRMGFPFVYFQRQVGMRGEPRTGRYGWTSTRHTKELLLQQYGSMLGKNEFQNPSGQAIMEAASYIYYPSGGCGPGEQLEDPSGARESHGDRVIADAGAAMLCREAPKYRGERGGTLKRGSYLGDRATAEMQAKDRKRRKLMGLI